MSDPKRYIYMCVCIYSGHLSSPFIYIAEAIVRGKFHMFTIHHVFLD